MSLTLISPGFNVDEPDPARVKQPSPVAPPTPTRTRSKGGATTGTPLPKPAPAAVRPEVSGGDPNMGLSGPHGPLPPAPHERFREWLKGMMPELPSGGGSVGWPSWLKPGPDFFTHHPLDQHTITDPVTGNWYYPQTGTEDAPGVGGKGGPAPGAIRTRTPRHWEEGPPDRFGNTEFLRGGDPDYINPGQERFDPRTGQWYKFGERGQGTGGTASSNVPPSQRGIFYRLGHMFDKPATGSQWGVEEGGGYRPAKPGEVPATMGGERVRGRGEHGGLVYDPETRTYEPASVGGEEHGGGHHRHGGGGFSGGIPGGLPPILQFILRMIMARGGGARPPFGGTGGTGTADTPAGTAANPWAERAKALGIDPAKITPEMMQRARQFGITPENVTPQMVDMARRMGIDLGHYVPPDAGATPAAGNPTGGSSPGGPVAAPATAPAPAAGAPAPGVAAQPPGAGAAAPVPPQPAAGDTAGPPGTRSIISPDVGGIHVPNLDRLLFRSPAGHTSDAAKPGLPAGSVQVASLDPRIGMGAVGAIGRDRERKGDRALSGAAEYNFGQGMHQGLAQGRQRFADELRTKPWLRKKFLAIMYNEQGKHPQGTQAVAESAMNRAIVRGTSLEKQLKWHGHERGGYYQVGNMGRGSERYEAALNQALDNALAGSNIAQYATDNSSGGLARRERASGKFRYRSGYSGESFFAPGWGEPQFARNWDSWVAQMSGHETAGR
jgi:hypothetical protein